MHYRQICLFSSHMVRILLAWVATLKISNIKNMILLNIDVDFHGRYSPDTTGRAVGLGTQRLPYTEINIIV
jgi:hypothetical protein